MGTKRKQTKRSKVQSDVDLQAINDRLDELSKKNDKLTNQNDKLLNKLDKAVHERDEYRKLYELVLIPPLGVSV